MCWLHFSEPEGVFIFYKFCGQCWCLNTWPKKQTKKLLLQCRTSTLLIYNISCKFSSTPTHVLTELWIINQCIITWTFSMWVCAGSRIYSPLVNRQVTYKSRLMERVENWRQVNWSWYYGTNQHMLLIWTVLYRL